jgi:hypothetical protein
MTTRDERGALAGFGDRYALPASANTSSTGRSTSRRGTTDDVQPSDPATTPA